MANLNERLYEKLYNRRAPDYVKDYTLLQLAMKPIRKWLVNTVAANCPFNGIRVRICRMCGFKIGKHVSLGMKCYLDDHCYDLMEIGDNVTISYGVFFACHGANQPHAPIKVCEGAYIGMRASIVSNNRDKTRQGVIIGEKSIVGACTLVNCDVPDGATAVGIPCKIIQKESE